MKKQDDALHLSHILKAARRIVAYTENLGRADFDLDFKTQDAKPLLNQPVPKTPRCPIAFQQVSELKLWEYKNAPPKPEERIIFSKCKGKKKPGI